MIKLVICFNFLNLKSYKKIDERTQSKLHTGVFLLQNCFFFGSVDQRGRRKSLGQIARWNSTFKSNFKCLIYFTKKNVSKIHLTNSFGLVKAQLLAERVCDKLVTIGLMNIESHWRPRQLFLLSSLVRISATIWVYWWKKEEKCPYFINIEFF